MALRAFYLTIAMFSATSLFAMSVYSTGAMSGRVPADGYGISVSVK
ncbi:MAG: hypothetical protein U5K75_05980 [Ahrensia sp.]|nr:hypothetical protein [Ahrensia sp.]